MDGAHKPPPMLKTVQQPIDPSTPCKSLIPYASPTRPLPSTKAKKGSANILAAVAITKHIHGHCQSLIKSLASLSFSTKKSSPAGIIKKEKANPRSKYNRKDCPTRLKNCSPLSPATRPLPSHFTLMKR